MAHRLHRQRAQGKSIPCRLIFTRIPCLNPCIASCSSHSFPDTSSLELSASPELGPRVSTAPAPLPTSDLTLVGNLVTLSALTESDVPSLWSHLYRANQTPVRDPFDYVPFGPYSSPSDFWTHLTESANDVNIYAVRADPAYLNPSASSTSTPETRTHVVGTISYVNIDPVNRALELTVINGDVLKRTAASTEAVYLMLCHAFGDTTGTAGVVGPTSRDGQGQGQGQGQSKACSLRTGAWSGNATTATPRRAGQRRDWALCSRAASGSMGSSKAGTETRTGSA